MRISNALRLSGLATALGLSILLSLGCSGEDNANRTGPKTKAEQDQQVQQQIAQIKSNTHMSDAQKAMALGALQSNQGNVKKP